MVWTCGEDKRGPQVHSRRNLQRAHNQSWIGGYHQDDCDGGYHDGDDGYHGGDDGYHDGDDGYHGGDDDENQSWKGGNPVMMMMIVADAGLVMTKQCNGSVIVCFQNVNSF